MCAQSLCSNLLLPLLLHQEKRFRVRTELPGLEGAAVCRAWLVASGVPCVDYATLNKGLEMSGNHKLA